MEKTLSQNKPILKLGWCSYQAAKYAVEHWHYSKTMPRSKRVHIGVWENTAFIGCCVFGLGGGAACDGRRYGLSRIFEMAELQRVALREHITPVSRIIAIAIRFLHRQSPKLKLIISYADPTQRHYGGIYQAGNWIYTGKSNDDWQAVFANGKRVHSRVAGRHMQYGRIRTVDISNAIKVIIPGKHRYLMPLDAEMRKRILPLAKPYPKRAGSDTKDTPSHQLGKGGSTPTPALQSD